MDHSPAPRVALRGDLLDFTAAPAWGDIEPAGLRFRPDHWLLVERGRIVGAQPGDQSPGDDWQRHDHHRQRHQQAHDHRLGGQADDVVEFHVNESIAQRSRIRRPANARPLRRERA